MKINLLFLCFMLLSVTSKAQNKKLAGKIIDTIFKIKEVAQRLAYVQEHSGGTRQLSVIFYTKPRKEPYYWVKVLEFNGDNYVTHFHFFVYPKPLKIKYYDTARDTAISLDEWRRETKISN